MSRFGEVLSRDMIVIFIIVNIIITFGRFFANTWLRNTYFFQLPVFADI